jgi:transcriptional regulator with XRE-family HTH domain
MTKTFSITDLRTEMGLTQTEFAVRLGLSSGGKPTVSLWETGAREVSFDAALKIEELSGGRIDAAQLNAQVARARAAGSVDHVADTIVADEAASTGQADAMSPGVERAA